MSKRACKADVDAIVGADHPDPFSFLGMHPGMDRGSLVVRAFLPQAKSVEVIDAGNGKQVAGMEAIHDSGLFSCTLTDRKSRFPYRLRVDDGSATHDLEDPYRFPPLLGELDAHLLAEGTHLDSYRKLGAHLTEVEGIAGVSFAVWAPSARRVSIVGDFNAWDGRRHPMRVHPGCGVWEMFVPGLTEGATYKFEIKARDGRILPLKADPYAFRCEMPPRTASLVHANDSYSWGDDAWMAGRADVDHRRTPVSIYEVHLGSWKRKPGEGTRFLSYAELADELIPYVVEMGFTHIELLPVSEFPFDGSWGYQPLCLFAPTSRFGSPDDFRAFIDRCHQEGIGVILDWVAGHFPEDAHGLVEFDGTHLYEHADPRMGRHTDWGTLIYNYGRNEVANYLLSNALFWLDQYHIDGLRVDAVASMLYLDYSRKEGEWIPNIHGGRENLDAIAFLKRLNKVAYEHNPGVLTIAEESTAWPMVSQPTFMGGLGFGFKWNMGWMHDTLRYMALDPVHRKFHHNDLTFGLLYAFSENFVLPLSHDEVVHGKGSIFGRMPGDDWQRFANLRLYYTFMFTYPGKKLLFMSNEFGQGKEWNHNQSLDWHLADQPLNRGVQNLVRNANALYRALPALHERDCEPDGFAWIDCNDSDQSTLSYLRRSSNPEDVVAVACNFTPVPRRDYRLGVPLEGWYAEVLNSDSDVYGGGNIGNFGGVMAEKIPIQGYPFSIALSLPPLAAVVFHRTPAAF